MASNTDESVLDVVAVPARNPATLPFHELSRSGSLVAGADGREHWLFTDGRHHVRLDVLEGSLCCNRIGLEFRVRSGVDLAPQVLALRQVSLVGGSTFEDRLFANAPRARRWAMIMRTWDALAAGASPREITEVLFALERVPRWRLDL